MKILAIESSAIAASVAVLDGGKLRAEFFINSGLTHSETLMPMVSQMLDDTKLSINEVDMFAVSVGPGSFTGVRIGVSCVKGMAFVVNKPIFGVSTLYGMAFNVLQEGAVICAVMDARCNQVYNAIFRVNGKEPERLTPDRALSIDELLHELEFYRGKKIIFVGDGARLCYNEENTHAVGFTIAPENLIHQRASSVALAALKMHERGVAAADTFSLVPEYLRVSQAERNLKGV